MSQQTESGILDEFRKRQSSYRELSGTVSDLIANIVAGQGVSLHSVTHRVKDVASLAKKLQRQDSQYNCLTDLTDLAGIRVTTYFHDHVDLVAKVIEQEFTIDRANSVDKRALLDPDRFGYLSLHYVIELSPQRCSLPEYKRFAGLKAEVQIRSLLQHVWAEVEHDLGYKSSRSVPSAIRRRFARLAGLLELADAEFAQIRDALGTYEKEVQGLIDKEPASVAIDKASLTAFVSSNELLRQIDGFIAKLMGAKIVIPDDPTYIDRDLQNLSFIGISSIGALEDALRMHHADIERFARVWLESSSGKTLHRGIGIFYLTYVHLALQRDPMRVREWAKRHSIGGSLDRDHDALVKRLIDSAAKAGLTHAV